MITSKSELQELKRCVGKLSQVAASPQPAQRHERRILKVPVIPLRLLAYVDQNGLPALDAGLN